MKILVAKNNCFNLYQVFFETSKQLNKMNNNYFMFDPQQRFKTKKCSCNNSLKVILHLNRTTLKKKLPSSLIALEILYKSVGLQNIGTFSVNP